MQWPCRARVGALNANRNDPFRNVIGTWIAASWRGYEGAKMRAAAGVIQGDMNENISVIVSRLSDDELVSKVKLLAQGSRQTTVQLIAHLAELAARGLAPLGGRRMQPDQGGQGGAKVSGHPRPAGGWLCEPDDGTSSGATPDQREPPFAPRRGRRDDQTAGGQARGPHLPEAGRSGDSPEAADDSIEPKYRSSYRI